MQILSVALRNFKSHADRQFSFEMGTNAICGENGAGKTSILEAIAWALFDHSPYTIDDMIREGANSAEVTVAFVSVVEDRTYEVRRSTATGYRLYDPQIDRRLEPEKKIDVLRWLRQHLGVPAGTDLPKLFSNTIGVPQGTFTADFLKTPQDRKRIFDSILKVEEYQEIYKDLLLLQKYGEEQVSASDHQIELCTVQLQEWDELQQQQQQLQGAIDRDRQLLASVGTQLEEIVQSLTILETTAKQIQVLEQQLQQAKTSTELKQQDFQRSQTDVEAAQQATKVVDENQQGHAAFEAAELALKELEQLRSHRQSLQDKRQQLLEANRDRDIQRTKIQERLNLLEQAEVQIESLAPLVVRQHQLEEAQQQLAEQRAKLQQLQSEQTLKDTKLDACKQRCQRAQEDLRVAQEAQQQRDADRPAYEQVCQADSRLAQLREHQHHREQLLQEQSQAIAALATIQQEQAGLQEQRQRVQHLDREIAMRDMQLPEQESLETRRTQLEAQCNQLQTVRVTLQQRVETVDELGHAIATVRAKIERRQALATTADTIPTLRHQIERCTHQLAHQSAARDFHQELDTIYQAGTDNLEDYRQQSKQLLQTLESTAQPHPELRSLLEPVSPLLRQGHTISKELLSQVAGILSDLAHQTDEDALTAQRQQLEEQLQEAMLAKSRQEELPALEDELQRSQHKLAELNEEVADLRWKLEAEDTCRTQLEDTISQLQALDNPRSQLAILKQERHTYRDIDWQRKQVSHSLAKHQAELTRLEDSLAPLTDLPEQIAAQQSIRQNHHNAYQRFLKLEELAGTLAQRQQRCYAASQELDQLQAEVRSHRLALEELVRAQGSAEAVSQQNADLISELEHLQNPRQQVTRLKADLQQRPNLLQQLDRLTESDRGDQQQLETIQAKLKATESIAQQYAEQQQQRDLHRTAFQTVLANQELAKTLPARKQHLSKLQAQLTDLDSQQATLREKRHTLAETVGLATLEHLQRSREEHKIRHTQLQTQIQAAHPQLERLTAQLTNLEGVRQQVTTLQAEKKQRERLQRFVKYIRKVFRDAGPRITELYQSSVNREADRLFREILNRPTVSLKWEPNYDITVQEGGSQKRKFASLSGGEQMVAALAVRLALLRALADIDVAFFDEPTTNMDRPRRERLAESISNIKSFKQLFVISHDDTFANITENIIRVEREL
ncbi:MAG: AAA family ATPase [Cyanobacteria bacterium P01_G01_bin.4]